MFICITNRKEKPLFLHSALHIKLYEILSFLHIACLNSENIIIYTSKLYHFRVGIPPSPPYFFLSGKGLKELYCSFVHVAFICLCGLTHVRPSSKAVRQPIQ